MISRFVKCTLVVSVPTKPVLHARSFTRFSMTKNSHNWTSARQQKKRKAQAKPKEGSDDEVLRADVARFRALHLRAVSAEDQVSASTLDSVITPAVSDRFREVEVKISYLSSVGNGLGLSSH